MAIAYVNGTAASSSDGNTVTTTAINTTAANLIVISVACLTAGSIGITDSAGNTWTALTAQTSINPDNRLFYCFAPTTSATHTFSTTGSSQFPSIYVETFSGVATSPFDQQNGGFAQATSIQPGSVTPTENDELIVTGISRDNSDTLSINSSFTITNQLNVVVNFAYGGGMAYLIQTTAAAVNPTWSWTNSTDTNSTIATFKAAAAGGATLRFLTLLGAGA